MDDFVELEVLGRGAFGTVTLCQRKSEQERLVVLKEIEIQETPEITEEEVKVVSSFHHPLIVRFFGRFTRNNNVFIIMEYMPGGTLWQYLKGRKGRLLAEDEVVRLFAQLVLALEHIHSRKVLHRDVKSKNILLSADHSVAKIGDFGISKILETNKSRAGSIVGTPEYFSPELCRGQTYGSKSDVWALGCVLYELMTLTRPFQASSVPALAVKILSGDVRPPDETYSKILRQLLKDMMHPEPSERAGVRACAACPLVAVEIVKLACSLGSAGV
ncbi:serine/threonine-protein kinase Nek8-like [Neocloeon triangulifer]|uniref:serine/threonine-protein kinase Nek8-like n=1 Tax=Neocloeon triangulifer TaxID=2078957 RepID=UPI00286EE434|nr:serine/threonine-protein kinase Nek8-like [Neocloeon triangulifer]